MLCRGITAPSDLRSFRCGPVFLDKCAHFLFVDDKLAQQRLQETFRIGSFQFYLYRTPRCAACSRWWRGTWLPSSPIALSFALSHAALPQLLVKCAERTVSYLPCCWIVERQHSSQASPKPLKRFQPYRTIKALARCFFVARAALRGRAELLSLLIYD